MWGGGKKAEKVSYPPLPGNGRKGAAKRVLPAEIRLSIRQVALHRVDGAAEAPVEAEARKPEESR